MSYQIKWESGKMDFVAFSIDNHKFLDTFFCTGTSDSVFTRGQDSLITKWHNSECHKEAV
jgi:hypothetical protein